MINFDQTSNFSSSQIQNLNSDNNYLSRMKSEELF